VRDEGGLAFAQDASAQFAHMSNAAAAAGAVDVVLPPKEIAAEILRARPRLTVARRLHEGELQAVFTLLRQAHDIDFTHYKPATIDRRIRRRMAMHKLGDLPAYLDRLRGDPHELESLCGDILIRVTAFFRDPEVFDALDGHVLPQILENRAGDRPVRVWVAGCATGEEPYSLAMLLLEAAGRFGVNVPIQIFGTDVSGASIDRARLGLYPETIAETISPERLRRFFTETPDGYRVNKQVRDCCVFARQNLVRDPPFSKLDLISCRNVLIYLGPVLQRKAMGIFHYALLPDGHLVLGRSETIGGFADLFTVASSKHKIYLKKNVSKRMPLEVTTAAARKEEVVERVRMQDENPSSPANVFREADRVMLTRFTPPGVLIDENMDILQFRGRTSRYLEPAPGAASFNLLKMAREGLLAELRAAVQDARKKGGPVRRAGVRVDGAGGEPEAVVDIEVVPFGTPNNEKYQLVLFHEVAGPAVEPAAPGRKKKKEDEENGTVATRLRRELDATREYLQSIIEEQEAMNEELRSANEEIQSSNEELQSTNEELETAKEELQSSNEELLTVNEELADRNQELAQANDDLVNLLASIDLPIVMLDPDLRIRRFNPGAQRVLSLIPGDVGRPIADLNTSLSVDALDDLVRGVIEDLEVRELEVKDRRGTTHLLRVRPYKTLDNRIEGAVIVLIDIDRIRKAAG
jgi:two-component system, chemotaxis family, CheB/CheR fusion protein